MKAGSSHTLSSVPNPLGSYARIFRSKNTYKEGDDILATEVKLEKFSFNIDHVKKYGQLCQQEVKHGQVPLLYPHSFLGPIHLKIFSEPGFPLRVMGSVHIRNHVIQHRPLYAGQNYSANLKFVDQRRRPQGLELDLRTEVFDVHKNLVWQSVSSYLFRVKLKEEDPESPLANVVDKIEDPKDLEKFSVPKDTGKRFGILTRDINPIHMSTMLAKLFGFKKDICHGMWALARSLPYVEGIDYEKPVRNDAIFKGPMFIGTDISVKSQADNTGHYQLYSGDNPRPCMLTSLKNVSEGETI